MLDKKRLYELKSKSRSLDPVIRIGKNGLTDGMLKEIIMHLKKKGLIKIKVLNNALSNSTLDDFIKTLTEKCNCVLIDKIGLTFAVYPDKSTDKL
jgi:RNA-binding protein